MVAVGVLRASGFLDFIAELLSGVCGKLGIPASIVPLIIVRLFSSSAATGLSLIYSSSSEQTHIQDL